ncbi:MAG: site-specific DNA-methyltransferase [Bifidobacteriaceae bacterium]|nr:site-specific DNA-methyltransferase [Bifidobacteriaceae bacterium]
MTGPAPHGGARLVLAAEPMVALRVGDALDVLATLPEGSADAVITDPPYAVGMDRWDTPAWFAGAAERHGLVLDGAGGRMAPFRAWTEAWAGECRRVLRPGGWLVCFGGARTWHHAALGIEQAGLEIRDQIAWLYTSGVPKSLDMSNAVDQHLGRARADRRVGKPAAGVLGSRKVSERGRPVTPEAGRWDGWGTALAPAFEPVIVARNPTRSTVAANLLAHGVGAINIDAGRGPDGRWPKNAALDDRAAAILDRHCAARPGDRSGMFPVFPAFRHHPKAPASERPVVDGVFHQTVKPLGLMRWLCRLFCPPGGTVLDPFAGTGTTLLAARQSGMAAVGIEIDPAHIPLIQARLAHADASPEPMI